MHMFNDKNEKKLKKAIGKMMDMGMTEDEIGKMIIDTMFETLSEEKYQQLIKNSNIQRKNDQ